MGILLDSETLLVWAEKPALLESWVRSGADEECFLSIISVDEMMRVVVETAEGRRRNRRTAFLESLLENLPILPLDQKTVRMHAEIRHHDPVVAELSDRDGWLAATCLAYGLSLVTPRVEVFRRVPGLLWQKPVRK